MASLTLDLGRTSPMFGVRRERFPDGTISTVQVNCAVFAVFWMRLSLSAMMAEWTRQVRRDAWDAIGGAGITAGPDEIEEIGAAEIEALIGE